MTEELKEPKDALRVRKPPSSASKKDTQAMYSEIVLKTEDSEENDRRRLELIRRGMKAMRLGNQSDQEKDDTKEKRLNAAKTIKAVLNGER